MRQLHIMLIEDNPGDVFITTEALNETKATRKISIATNGDEAMHFFEGLFFDKNADYPDLIFMDTYLQNTNSYGLLNYIKTTNLLRHIPVIISTDSAYENDINNAYQNLATAFVSKSSEVDVYIDHISKTIEYWTTIATLPILNNSRKS